MKKAIVTLAIGKPYEAMFDKYCKSLWAAYAKKHGFDLIVITEHLDDSPRSLARNPSWQKCLIFNDARVKQYDRVVWVDSDILINPNSPDITAGVPFGKIGVVDEAATPTRDDLQVYLDRPNKPQNSAMAEYLRTAFDPTNYYKEFGLEGKFSSIVQGGVIVLSREHQELMERVYYKYEDKGPEWNYEQRPLGYEIMTHGKEHWLSPKFNMTWVILKALSYPFLDSQLTLTERVLRKTGYDARAALLSKCMTNAFLNNYFLHYAGGKGSDMQYVTVMPEML